MATLADIDTKSLVSKYLNRQVVTPPSDDTGDSADEITAILESAATTFLLYPQAALSIAYRAANTLQQSVALDIQMLDFISAALLDLGNPSNPVADTSDLIDARNALIAINQSGTVDPNTLAVTRFNQAVTNFLNQKLAKPLKRHNRGSFERTGVEAQQDLVQGVGSFTTNHQLVIDQLATLANAATNFESVDLTRMVSARTIARVQSMLAQLQQGAQQGAVSPTVMALELLASTAAMQSISSLRGLFDPTIQTGVFPPGPPITADVELAPATALSTAGPWDIHTATTPWLFDVTVDSTSYSIPLPATSASDRAWVAGSAPGAATHNIPSTYQLYLLFDTTYIVVPLTTGSSVAIATTISDINTAISGYGTCAQLYTGSNRLIIYGAGGVTQVVVLGIGRATGSTATPAAPSAHAILGFQANQTSNVIGVFSASDLATILQGQIPTLTFNVVGSQLSLTSVDTSPGNQFSFSTGVGSLFGFNGTYVSEPDALSLMQSGAALAPGSVGVFVGSLFTVKEVGLAGRTLNAAVTSIVGNDLLFAGRTFPRGTGLSVTVVSPMVVAIQGLLRSLVRFVGSFNQDLFNLQKVLSPLFTQATQAQLNDAANALAAIRIKLTSSDPNNRGLLEVLQAVVVSPSQDAFGATAEAVLQVLESRGLDNAFDLLSSCAFSQFFAINKDTAAKSANLLTALSAVVRNTFPPITDESQMSDSNPVVGDNPDTNLLPGAEPSSG